MIGNLKNLNVWKTKDLSHVELRKYHRSSLLTGSEMNSKQIVFKKTSPFQLNMSVDPCYKKDDLLLETITDAMQDVAIKTRQPDYEDDMAVSQVRQALPFVLCLFPISKKF